MSSIHVEPPEIAFAKIVGKIEIVWNERSVYYRDPVVTEFGGAFQSGSIEVVGNSVVYTFEFLGPEGKRARIEIREEI